jgi:hypothetical protein
VHDAIKIPGWRLSNKTAGDSAMKHFENKRSDERFLCGSPIEWAYFNKSQKHSARMRNFSHTGACFESRQAILRGATIMVRLETYEDDCRMGCAHKSDCPWPRSIALGEVKWCRDMAGCGLPVFGVGVKFHFPV